MNDLYIGLMSGTSIDGIDAVLVDFSQAKPHLLATHYTPYDDTLRRKITALCQAGENEIHRLGELDVLLAKEFAKAVKGLLSQQTISPQSIKAIGSHGQTIRHSPSHPPRFTLQIGDPNTLAAETGITTVADFRRKDMAYGGQGAPLVPAFHHYAFSSTNASRAIANIGGIANITLLSHETGQNIIGFDTGPGNVLMDGWIQLHQQKTHDADGKWAAQGKVNPNLLKDLLNDAYFKTSAPKSTGREYFNLAWLQKHELVSNMAPVDVQATLVELTAQTIAQAILPYLANGEILVCGGGARNTFLMSRLQEIAKPHFLVQSTQALGIHPDWVEAVAFAWLARQTMNRHPGNLPSVTGATQAAVLGGVYLA